MIPFQAPDLGEAEARALTTCIEAGDASGNSPTVRRFEAAFARALDVRHAVAVSSGTAALHLAFASLGIGPGDEVILPSFTFAPCADMIAHLGATPIFVDSQATDFNLRVAEVAASISPATRAILAVHLNGHPCDLEPLLELCYRRGLYLVEDCAQALGACYHSQFVGTFGALSCFSFYASKIITTGEGGMVVTNDDQLAATVRHLRSHALFGAPGGIYMHQQLAFNYRMPAPSAAIGTVQLERLEEFLERRHAIAGYYQHVLTDIPGLRLPQTLDYCTRHAHWAYAVLIDEAEFGHSRTALIAALAQRGIEARPFYYPLHLHPVYSQRCLALPECEMFARIGIGLPSASTLQTAQLDQVAAALREIQAGAS